jgi:predicted DNA-binding transcriptional regulator
MINLNKQDEKLLKRVFAKRRYVLQGYIDHINKVHSEPDNPVRQKHLDELKDIKALEKKIFDQN